MSSTDIPEFPSNSIGQRGAKHMDLQPQQKKIVPVAKGVKRQKPFVDKFAETFWGEDADTVGKYLFYDVLLPAAKNTLYDMVKTGVEMLLWGETSKRTTINARSTDRPTVISYNTIFQGNKGNERRESRPSGRYNFDYVVFPSRKAADAVLDVLLEAINEYGMASVADYYQAAEVASEYTDNQFGWTSLAQARVIPERNGFIIELPRPFPLNSNR